MSLTFVERNAAQHGPTYVAAFEAVVIRDGEPLAFYTEESLHLAKEHFLSAAAWCEENLGDYWYDTKPNHETILFYTLREAAAFKLRWGLMTDNNITADIRIFLGPKGTTHPYRLKVVASTHRYGVCTELLTEMRQWCTDHIGHDVWARHSYVDGQQLGMTIFAFTSPDAVMMFKMRWC